LTTNTQKRAEVREPAGLLNSHIAGFLAKLRAAGYSERTLKKKQSVATAFIKWSQGKKIRLHELNEAVVAAFLGRSRERRATRVKFEKSALRLLLDYLRHGAGVPDPLPSPCPSPVDGLVCRYVDYLRKDRGLAENSILVYVPFVRDLLRDQVSRAGDLSVKAFDAATIRSFLLSHVRERSGEYRRLLATSLRSFFRFLFLCGDLAVDLSLSVPSVRKCQKTGIPAFLSPEEIDRVLAATDQSTATGRRDYAILLLLARLGLRAGEIVTLELNDVLWRSGEIVVRGKGRITESLPLPADVGAALARYLREDRSVREGRRVFRRVYAPPVGLTGPAAVGHIVRLSLTRAGVQRSGRGAAHLFRHGLGTQMIRKGASLAEIAEVLRHRSLNTTAIYAQVSFEALRTVATPWPVIRGDR
jgi:site-specific recombinase XerD